MRRLNLKRTIGRRGMFLILASVIWFCMGGSVYATADRIDPADAIVYEVLPIWFRTGLWVGTGLVATAAAFIPSKQHWGFLSLIVMPFERAFGNAWSFFHYLRPDWPPGEVASAFGFILWSAILGIVFVASGWDEDVVVAQEE